MSGEKKNSEFDPNGPGIKGNLFGLPVTAVEVSQLVIVPVPWEVTVTQRTGTAKAPRNIIDVSYQVDLFSKSHGSLLNLGMSTLPFPESLFEENEKLRPLAHQHIELLEKVGVTPTDNFIPARINEACENLHVYVKNTSRKLLQEKKMVGLLGGDHSIPLGFLRALSELHDRFAILQLDAHADLRKNYEGFTYSHASIMYNALKLPAVARLVQVGVRDYCDQEYQVIQRSMGRIKTFFDEDIKASLFAGTHWERICNEIIAELPDLVYISFDIDSLDPSLCQSTGTPVPGGLSFDQAKYLLKMLVASGKKIVGFDLCEVSGEHAGDAQVGARILLELCSAIAASNGKLNA